MEVTPSMLLIVCPLIFLSAWVDAIAGGGGIISLPTYLLAGLPAQLAAGSNKLSACFGMMLSTTQYAKQKKILYKPALLAVMGSFPGSYIGAWLQQQTPEHLVRAFMLIAIPVVGVAMLLKRDTPVETKPLVGWRLASCFFIGLGCGFYDGFFGPGTGTLLILLFTWVTRMDMVSASGCSKLVNFSSGAAALISFLRGGQVLFPLAVPATICSLLGGYIGARMALKRGARLIRIVMLCVLMLLIGKLALEFFGVHL